MGSQQSHTQRALRQGGDGDERVTVINIEDIQNKRDAGKDKMIQALSRVVEANKVENHDQHQKGLILLKQIFKRMDPAITYGATYRNQGQLELSVKYDASKEVLLVRVIRALHLDAKSLQSSCASVYVKVFFLPSSNEDIVHKTKVISGTLDPVFHEIFALPTTEDQWQNGSIVFQVWNADAMDNDELIGETTVEISCLDLRQCQVHTDIYQLKAEAVSDIRGNLQVTLAYDSSQFLNVTIQGATNLANDYTEGAPNPFVKLQISGINQIYKTKVMYNTENPVWQERFQLKIASRELKKRQLIFHVIDFNDGDCNHSLGQAITNLSDLDTGHISQQELELADLKSGRHIHSSQAQNVALQEFKQALVAHAVAKCPNFLFRKSSGSKMVRVQNTKNGSEAKLRVIDAIPVY